MIRIAPLAALLLAASAGAAHAHVGDHGLSLAAGFEHPMTGLDHVLAMVGIGVWAAQRGVADRRAVWTIPAAFVAMMLAGAVAGWTGLRLPMIEAGIVGSVVLLGLLLLSAPRLPSWAPVATAAVFAVFHGYAHGAEIPAGGALAGYAAGFVAATIVLHAAGIGIGSALIRAAGALGPRGFGGALVLGGAAIAVGIA
ncbi:MAG: HupE/UreJ family protein [Rhodospirillales bacterium]|nr:HupE/UreJ family protein [Rhodospirillales bacterium]